MPASRDVVLLLTHRDDFYTIDRVAAALGRRGARPLRVDTDRFPTALRLTAALDEKGSRHALAVGGEEVDAEAIRAVWVRHLAPPRFDGDLDPAFRDGCARESAAALRGFFDGLAGRRFVESPDVARAATNKLRQLRLARAAGLAIPRTLVTNDPDRVRTFAAALGGDVVAKMLTPLAVSMDGRAPFVHTSALTAADLEDLDGLALCPMVFQERVAKARELRVALVGGRAFAGAIDARASAAGRLDWRRASPAECEWRPVSVPDEVAAALRGLMAALGLAFGAADLIVTPEGRHVFLEVNPTGEWGMLERDLGLPIADAIAEALLQ